jgi:Raf kinase inhibitor-like YbhB/YbcL family protein
VRRALGLALLALTFALPACGGDDGEPAATPPPAAEAFGFPGGDGADAEPIDPRFSCDGENVSPALTWEEPPAGTVELALVVDDPDAPGGSFVHWVAFGIPPEQTELATGSSAGIVEGANDAGGTGWTGPCPPGGETHGYVFTLYALDAETGLEAGASLDDLRAAIDGHVLGEATLTAPFSHR